MEIFSTLQNSDNEDISTSQKSGVVFGVETVTFNSNTGGWEMENNKNVTFSVSVQYNKSTANNAESMSIWVLQVQPYPIFNQESTNNSDVCLSEAENTGLISLLFENCYRINSGLYFSSKTEILSHASNFLSTRGFDVTIDEKNSRLLIEKRY